MPFSVTAALDKHVARLEEERQPDGYWHPSGLFGCPRKTIYEARGVEKSNPPDERARRVFRVGHILHAFVQEAISLDDEVVAFYAEVKVLDEQRRIKGSADGLLRFASGRWLVLEFKTINSMAFRYNDLPKVDHKGQASVYMDILRTHGGTAELADGTPIEIPPLGDDLTRARFAYISKDDLKVEEFDMLWSDAKAEVIDERVAELEAYQAEGTLPPRLPLVTKPATAKTKARTEKDYQCRYCSFHDLCWSGEGEA